MSVFPFIRILRREDLPREPYWHMCRRVSELAHPCPSSVIRKCTVCDADIWYHPESCVWKPGEILICTPCLVKNPKRVPR